MVYIINLAGARTIYNCIGPISTTGAGKITKLIEIIHTDLMEQIVQLPAGVIYHSVPR